MLHLGKQRLDLADIRQPPDGDHLGLVRSLNGRNETLGACRVDQLRIAYLAAVIHGNFLLLCVHGSHRPVQNLNHIVLLIPGRILHGNLFLIQPCHDGFGQHGAVVGAVRFVGNHQDGTCLIPLPNSFGGVESGRAVSDDHIEIFCIVPELNILCLHRHKVLFSHTAHRAYFQGRVEISPHTRHFTSRVLPDFFLGFSFCCRRHPKLYP